MDDTRLSLQNIADATGVEIRTLRSWITQGLLLPPTRPGRAATYPSENIDRARAIRAMREHEGRSLAEIGRLLWLMSADDIAEKAALITGETKRLTTAREYLQSLLSNNPSPGADRTSLRGSELLRVYLGRAIPGPAPRTSAAKKVTVFWVNADIEIHIRGEISQEIRTDFEHIAALIRIILDKAAIADLNKGENADDS